MESSGYNEIITKYDFRMLSMEKKIMSIMLLYHFQCWRKDSILFFAVICILIILCICFYFNHHLVVTRYVYATKEVSQELVGYKILQISDLHNQFYGRNQRILIDKIKSENPNVIFVTGDVVDSYHTDYKRAISFFENAVKIADVYYVTGNHEVRLKGKDFDDFISKIVVLGVNFIDDSIVSVDGYILVGLSDDSLQHHRSTIKTTNEGLTVCLAHNPKYYDDYIMTGANIVFCGHMHGGQFNIPGKGGLFSPETTFFPDLYEGEHEFESETGIMTMYISRGLGNSIIPLRINNYPEIVVVTLNGKG